MWSRHHPFHFVHLSKISFPFFASTLMHMGDSKNRSIIAVAGGRRVGATAICPFSSPFLLLFSPSPIFIFWHAHPPPLRCITYLSILELRRPCFRSTRCVFLSEEPSVTCAVTSSCRGAERFSRPVQTHRRRHTEDASRRAR